MKHSLYISFLLFSFTSGAQGIWAIPKPDIARATNPYTHSYMVSIAAYGSSNITNLTVLDTFVSSYLATTTNGGSVQNTITYNGQTVPADVVFSASPSYGSLVSWEVKYYNPATGMLVVYLQIPAYSYTSGATLYMGIGSATTTTYQGGGVGSGFDANTVLAAAFPDGTTLSALDYSAQGNNGTITNATAYSGFAGGVAQFSGSGNYIDYGIPSSLQYTGASTLSGWFYIESYPGAQILMGEWSDGHFGNTILTIGTAIYGLIGVGTGSSNYGIEGYSYSTTNSWIYLSVVFTPSVGVYLYINGSLAASNTTSPPSSQVAGNFNNHMSIGEAVPQGSYPYNGLATDCRVRTEAVSANQLLVEYDIEQPGSTATALTLNY